MALINGMYIFVEKESVKNAYGYTDNKVEKGLPLTDHVERKPVTLSVNAMLLDTDSTTAYDQYVKLRNWASKGEIVKYVGRNIMDVAITDIGKDSDYKVANGATVSISLKEIRIGTSKKTSSKSSKQKQGSSAKKYHTVRKGETLSYIAKKYGKTASELKKKNKLKSNKVKKGKKLLVKW